MTALDLDDPAGSAAAAQRREIREALRLALVSALAVLVLYVVLVRTRWGQEIDDLAFEGRGAVRPESTARLDSMLRTVTEVSLFLLGGAIVLLALAQRRVRLAFVVGACMSAAVLTTELLKHVVLGRPSFAGIEGITHNSYPSGHATIGMVLSLGLVMVSSSRWRRAATVAAAVLATVFGTAVLSTGWHRPSDSLGAFAVALAWFAAGHALLVWSDLAHPYRYGIATDTDRPPSQGLLVAAGLALLAFLVVLLVRTLDTDGFATVDGRWLYVVACLVIDVVGLAVVLLFATLTGDRARLRREAWAAARPTGHAPAAPVGAGHMSSDDVS